TQYAVDLLTARGQHDDRGVEALPAQLAADVPAAHVWHHHVEQDQIGHVAEREREAVPAVGGREDVIALEAQVVAEPPYHLRLVVDDEDPGHRGPLSSFAAPRRGGRAGSRG